MHRKMVKSDLISGGHVRPGPDMAGYENLAGFRPGLGAGRIWYQAQPYKQQKWLTAYRCFLYVFKKTTYNDSMNDKQQK